MSIYKNIEVKHTVVTTAEDYTNYPRISFEGTSDRPIKIGGTNGGYTINGDSLSLTTGEAKDLVVRLSLFLDSIEDIKSLGKQATESVGLYNCTPMFYSDL